MHGTQRNVATVFLDDLVVVRDAAAERAQLAASDAAAKAARAASAAASSAAAAEAKKVQRQANSLSRLQRNAAAAGIVVKGGGGRDAPATSASLGAAGFAGALGAGGAGAGTGAGAGAAAAAGGNSSGADGGTPRPLGLDPSRVRLVKISAEGLDSRALNGMRRLLAVGRVPFVVFVFNDAHVRNAGCDPSALLGSLVEAGYSLWHGGVFFRRPVDIQRFVRGQVGRTMELLFVGPETEWS
jgi:hypothetical protein